MIEKLDEGESVGRDHIVYSFQNRKKINELIDAHNAQGEALPIFYKGKYYNQKGEQIILKDAEVPQENPVIDVEGFVKEYAQHFYWNQECDERYDINRMKEIIQTLTNAINKKL